MANYFANFPLTLYNLSDCSTVSQLVTNILSRYVIEKNIRDNMIFYEFYDVRDGDTPENIAYKIYNSSERHWLVLAANDIIDVETQWPLTFKQLNEYINEKYFIFGDETQYSGLEWAKNNQKQFYRVEKIIKNSKVMNTNKFEIGQNTYSELANTLLTTSNTSPILINPSKSITLADGTFITIANSVETKTYYEYEYDLNEQKRNIKLLRFEYVDLIENELKTVFSE